MKLVNALTLASAGFIGGGVSAFAPVFTVNRGFRTSLALASDDAPKAADDAPKAADDGPQDAPVEAEADSTEPTTREKEESSPEPTIVETEETETVSQSKSDLMALAAGQNNVLKYYDPLSLADADFWEQGDAATIGFLRHAEIKHGRVAMAAFVGYCVQSQGIRWPFAMNLDGDSFPTDAISPEAQWDAVVPNAKWQILGFIGLLELLSENSCGDLENQPHYMRGGQPGKYPDFEIFPNLYDPFGIFKKMKDEQKAKRLNIEVNNGRLAMIGIFGFMAADTVPGSVPLLANIAQPYDGNIMAPFAADFSLASSFGS
jgi:hypothetical protein